ncbi:phosphate/phosphite/phosphonate ABC transporter substrate-binding protein [Natronorubrum sp. DTA7]|uniref:phosphate/phosphite/phosphonate ABC transporter substrate-binding protein n=1 Tax=Natronorubrum sp. DTA7 TaxID=3447016 RepID=UPI003F8623D6
MRHQDATRFGGRRTFMKTAAAAATVGSVGIAGCAEVMGRSDDSLVFGIIPAEDNLDILQQWGPVGDHLQENTAVEIEFFEATDYTGIVEAQANDNVDIAWYGAFSYILAHERAGAEAIVREIDSGTGDTSYQSFITTHHDDVDSFADMEGLSAAFVDPASTSGFLIPTAMMLDEGYNPEDHFGSLQFSGDHSSGQIMVREERADVAPVASMYYNNLVDDGEIDPDEVRIVAESDPIPNTPIAVHPDLDDDLVDEIAEAFLSFDDEETLDILNSEGWEETSDSDYDVIRNVRNNLDEAGIEVGS